METIRKQPCDRRDTILRAARRCFVEHGFHATGMAEICVEAGMSPGNLYRYFKNKAAIIQAIADETRNRIVPVFEQLRNHQDPVEGIVQIILLSVKEFCHGPDGRLWMDILAEASRNKEIRKLCMALDQHVRACLKELLKRVAEKNRLRLELDVEATSVWLIALLDGAVARFSMDPDMESWADVGEPCGEHTAVAACSASLKTRAMDEREFEQQDYAKDLGFVCH